MKPSMGPKKTPVPKGPSDLDLAYRHAFATPSGELVLKDLKRLADDKYMTLENVDPIKAVYLEGRRYMYSYIRNKLGEDE